jgi:hypothetical protein
MGEEEEYRHTGRKVRLFPIMSTGTTMLPLTCRIADRMHRDQAYLESLVPEVEKNVDGRRVMVEGEDDSGDEAVKNDKDA